MSQTQQLTLDIQSYWHTGNGQGNGYHLDALCERDQDQLPMVPGRQIKGLLRQAVHRAEQWGWLEKLALPEGPMTTHEALLFGSTNQQEERTATLPGLLFVDSALLPDAERQWLAQSDTEATDLREQLFGELYSTAIESDTGSAKRYSLRGTEVCIPLTMIAELSLNTTGLESRLIEQQQAYLQSGTGWQVLETALPLLDAIGAHRNRGFGEVIAHLSQGSSTQTTQVQVSVKHSSKPQQNARQAKKHQNNKRKGR